MVRTKELLPVFVGRFQPLHLGHMEVIKQLSAGGEFAIAIGSMQESGTYENPLDFWQRKKMLEIALEEQGIIDFRIFGIPDYNDDTQWSEKLISLAGTRNIIVHTRNSWTKRCLDGAGIRVIKNPLYFGLSATQVRSKIARGLKWKHMVSKATARFVESIGGISRIRNLSASPEKKIVSFIRGAVSDSGAKGCIVGVSGGVDSAVTALLAKKALGDKAFFVYIPFGEKPCPSIKLLSEMLEIKTLSLEGVYETFIKALPNGNPVSRGNLQSRLRMCALYYFANQGGLLVMGTTNRSEMELGYFTKYGDGGADIEPIADLYKSELFALARKIGVPEEIIQSTPSAGLWEGQTDEGEIGLSYFGIDTVLKMLSLGFSAKEISRLTAVPLEKVESIILRKRSNLHKLSLPPVCRRGTR